MEIDLFNRIMNVHIQIKPGDLLINIFDKEYQSRVFIISSNPDQYKAIYFENGQPCKFFEDAGYGYFSDDEWAKIDVR